MKQQLLVQISEICKTLDIEASSIKLDYPENPEHGDFTTNVAMVNAKKLGKAPKVLAEAIVAEFKKKMPAFVREVSIAGPGFINFSVKDEVIAREAIGDKVGKGWGQSLGSARRHLAEAAPPQVMVEYTDPNPLKVFHIGHLMANAIGESISRLIETSGASVIRANWQGDVGPHVAKAIWGAIQIQDSRFKIQEGVEQMTKDEIEGKRKKKGEKPEEFWGRAYVAGAKAYESDPEKKKEIDIINKKIYERSDPSINDLYDKGRAECLVAFEVMYARLGTKFNDYYFESIEGREGEAIVRKFLSNGVFEESEGAIVFKGEKYSLHTRVFITSNGLPTYETKELGLNAAKFVKHPDLSESIIVTANEQSDYFRVLLKVMEQTYPDIAKKTKHISHGLLRFASGKMSSRKGNVIAAETLIADIRNMVAEKIMDRGFSIKEAEEISETVAIGAIKYTILRSSIGSDIVFDSTTSISFDGDSGPYLQYSAVRAASVLRKVQEEGIIPLASAPKPLFSATGHRRSSERSFSAEAVIDIPLPPKVGLLEKLLIRFPDIIARARNEYAPQHVTGYLTVLAGAFNSFYANQVIIDKKDKLSPYYVALTKAFLTTMTKGLWVLGIKVPERM